LAHDDKSAQAEPIAPNENTQKTSHLLTIIKPLKKNKNIIQFSPFGDDTDNVQQVLYLLNFIER
jgi:hypothetical protein